MATCNDGSEADGYSYYTPSEDVGGEALASESVQSDYHMPDVFMETGGYKSSGALQEKDFIGTGQQASLAPSESVQPHDSASYRNQSEYASNFNNASANRQAGYPSGPVQPEHGLNLRYCYYFHFNHVSSCQMQPQDWKRKQWVAHLIDNHLYCFSSQYLLCNYCHKSFDSADRKHEDKVKKMANHLYDHMKSGIAIDSEECTSQTPSNASSTRYAGTGGQFQDETFEFASAGVDEFDQLVTGDEEMKR